MIRAAQLNADLADDYRAVEARIGHCFRNDLSMADIVTTADASSR